ncbi:hypothetical protein VNO78_28194 [Psophocarpus tetragonolobus]|uniref:Uncharacterized protein n=1 Tax=Psophocarpus tetragonolobus TaxID=3891 RepID=A0AAN9S1K2_PSOTE
MQALASSDYRKTFPNYASLRLMCLSRWKLLPPHLNGKDDPSMYFESLDRKVVKIMLIVIAIERMEMVSTMGGKLSTLLTIIKYHKALCNAPGTTNLLNIRKPAKSELSVVIPIEMHAAIREHHRSV